MTYSLRLIYRQLPNFKSVWVMVTTVLFYAILPALFAEDPLVNGDIESKDVINIIMQQAVSIRTLDVWYSSESTVAGSEHSLNHLMWNLVTGGYRIEQYNFKDVSKRTVSNVHIETIANGKCLLLNQYPVENGSITIDQQGSRHDEGTIISSGFVGSDNRRMFVDFIDLFSYPYSKNNVFSAIRSEVFSVSTVNNASGSSTWNLSTSAAKLSFSRPGGLFLEANYFFVDSDSKKLSLLSKRKVDSYFDSEGINIPKTFTCIYASADSSKPMKKVVVSLVPELSKVNVALENKIVAPKFPAGTLVTDDIKRESYTVSEFDTMENTSSRLIEALDESIKKAEAQKQNAKTH